jgi:hypothetical protein
MNKKAWAMKFKKYAVLAGVNEPKKSCHGVRKARAEVAAGILSQYRTSARCRKWRRAKAFAIITIGR